MQHLAEGRSTKTIASAEQVSERVILKIRANIRTFGCHTAPPITRLERPPTITAPIKAGLRAYLKDRPWAYQDEMQLYLYDDWGIVVDQSTVSRVLKSMDISRKMLKRIAEERDQDCRNGYQFQIANYSADMLVYVDELAANEHTKDRKYRWSAFDVTPHVVRPVKRSERWSILPAYTVDRILCHHIHQGAINGARYEWWLENEVFSRCSRFPGPRSVLIIDNASIYHAEVSLYQYSVGYDVFTHIK